MGKPINVTIVSSRTHKEAVLISGGSEGIRTAKKIKGKIEDDIFDIQIKNSGAGGVASVIKQLQDDKEKGISAIGFSGVTFENTEGEQALFQMARAKLQHHNISIIPFTEEEYTKHYLDFCNLALWFLLHSDNPILQHTFNHKMGLSDQEKTGAGLIGRYRPRTEVFENFQTYEEINKRYVIEIMTMLMLRQSKALEIQFVQDYQLMLVPGLLRERIQNSDQFRNIPIGFFLHIPFPGPTIFEAAIHNGFHKEHLKKILLGMLGADQIGFHTDTYRRNFLSTLAHFSKQAGFFSTPLIINQEESTVRHENGRVTRVIAAPIGIDYKTYAPPEKELSEIIAGDYSEQDKVTAKKYLGQVEKFEAFHKNTIVILSVERADPIKGILEKLLAFEKMLKDHEELIDHVSYECIAVESRVGVRANDELKAAIELVKNRINQKYSTSVFPEGPVRYSNKGFDTPVVGEFYRRAHIMNAVSLADGMNLTAMEYIAARNEKTGGLLMLSSRMGVTDRLKECGGLEHCEVVNLEQEGNIDAEGKMTEEGIKRYAQSLYHAVQRSQKTDEAEEGMQALKSIVQSKCSVRQWGDNFLTSLDATAESNRKTWEETSASNEFVSAANSRFSSTHGTPNAVGSMPLPPFAQVKTKLLPISLIYQPSFTAQPQTPTRFIYSPLASPLHVVPVQSGVIRPGAASPRFEEDDFESVPSLVRAHVEQTSVTGARGNVSAGQTNPHYVMIYNSHSPMHSPMHSSMHNPLQSPPVMSYHNPVNTNQQQISYYHLPSYNNCINNNNNHHHNDHHATSYNSPTHHNNFQTNYNNYINNNRINHASNNNNLISSNDQASNNVDGNNTRKKRTLSLGAEAKKD